MKKIIFIISFLTILNSNSISQPINNGNNWINQVSGVNELLWDVSFYDANTGFAVGEYGKILKTTNGGENWILNQFYWRDFLLSIANTNSKTWYVATYTTPGMIFKTTNTGQTWDSLILPNTGGITRIDFVNELVGFGISKYYFFFKTIDGGLNWSVNTTLGSQNWSLEFIDENTGYVGGQKTYKTTNSGLFWDTVHFGIPFYSADIQFINRDTGFAAGQSYSSQEGIIERTTNGGLDWEATSISNSMIEDIYFVNERIGYAINCEVHKTTDGGDNWFLVKNCENEYVWKSHFVDTLTGYVVGIDGTILKTTNGGGEPIGISNISELSPESYALLQNYPNPFNPNTVIRFEIPKSSFVRLSVYDNLGRKVDELIGEFKNAGVYETNWDATDFPSGIYFYRIESGNFIETKRMILLK